MRPPGRAAFVLRVERSDREVRFVLHDLGSGRRLEFSSWRRLERFVENVLRTGLR